MQNLRFAFFHRGNNNKLEQLIMIIGLSESYKWLQNWTTTKESHFLITSMTTDQHQMTWNLITMSVTISENYPFTPESDERQNSPAASQEIWHHTVWRTWLFIAYSDEKWLYYKFSLHHSYNRFLKGWENTLFELRSERVNVKDLIGWFEFSLGFYWPSQLSNYRCSVTIRQVSH